MFAALLAETAIRVTTDDRTVLKELSTVFGSAPVAGAAFELSAGLSEGDGDELRLTSAALAATAERLFASSDALEFPFDVCDDMPLALAWKGEREPMLRFDGDSCLVSRRGAWQRAVALLLLNHLFRLRHEFIFLHAATVGIDGRGVLLIGPKGHGKSTIALALAARGHELLGDENAAWSAARRQLLPFLRPVGIKPGPRAMALDAAVARHADEAVDGIVRIDASLLLPLAAATPKPLSAIFFLRPFAAHPNIERIVAERETMARLQPHSLSMSNLPLTMRLLQLTAMLDVPLFELAPGAPEETALAIEQTVEGLN